MTLERYREIVPDWDAFVRATRRPEPTTLRLRRREAGGDAVPELRRLGFELSPIDGLEGFLRVGREPFAVSKSPGHWLGDFYIQQAVTGVAAPALGPRAGERILDLCAAPGGKTTHLADRMGDTGTVVAVDSNANRIRALLANVYRLSHPNVLVVEGDGRTLPTGARFDRVLVDVPCSAEGNIRRHGGRIRRRDSSFSEHIAETQRALLKRALELVRPGGVVLYVTCTFAPEENEAVVDHVLRESSGELEAIDLDLPHAPGVTSFQGRSYRDDLELAWRIYPHHLDSGGLFLARIRRPGSGREPEDGWSAVPERFPDVLAVGGGAAGSGAPARSAPESTAPGLPVDEEARRRSRERIREGVAGIRETFGLEEGVIRGVRWIERGDSVWMHRLSGWPFRAWDPEAGWRVISLGIRAMKEDPRTVYGERPTSDLLRMLDGRVQERVVDLGEEELLELLDRRSIELGRRSPDGGTPQDRSPAGKSGDSETVPGVVARGFVAIRHRGRILGRGWVKDGVLSNEISKARSRQLLTNLRASKHE
ncbi:MAG: RsmB/NOP family class I SAM-dependent RNA methyltransferase [Longimicrobiales bacterium]|nr:RsmB/NOP family class I SAM-dependent RNA methyltransferase [Longimicrobiales bacterium]